MRTHRSDEEQEERKPRDQQAVRGALPTRMGLGEREDLLPACLHPRWRLGRGQAGPEGYWPRTWVLRALLYVWEPSATDAVISATSDAHWRVREMALKVIAKHRLDDALERLAVLTRDPVPRVREAAGRAQAR